MIDIEYKDLLRKILRSGEDAPDRTGVGKRSIFGHQMRFDLREGFPLLSLRPIPLRLAFEELMWMLSGSTNIRDLQARNVRFWDPWEDKESFDEDGNYDGHYLGFIYGYQWRSWNEGDRDQILDLLRSLKEDPHSRRHIVTAWNPTDVAHQVKYGKAPPPCHCFFQCYVSPQGHLDLQLYQRSADVVIGVPFNIASYALLLTLLAREVGLVPRYFVHTLGDAHIYRYPEHLEAARTMLDRGSRPLPTLYFNEGTEGKGIFGLQWSDLHLEGYDPHPQIKDLPVAV